MKSKKLFLWFLVIFSYLISASQVYSLAKPTHQALNENIAQRTINKFSLNDYLINRLGFKEGVAEILQVNLTGRRVFQWLGEGGIQEDNPEGVPRQIGGRARNQNHFHNPLDPWDEAVLSVLPYSWQSSIVWTQNRNQSPGGRWSWHDARDYFYQGLTFTDKNKRNSAMANCFRALGQLMHLVQDASVPAHVRDDVHVLYMYEDWVEDIRQNELATFGEFIANPIAFDKTIFDLSPNSLAPVPIAKIIDTDKYVRTNPNVTATPEIGLPAIGIAEYANANFFSEDTRFSNAIPYPAETSADVENREIPDPRGVRPSVMRPYYIKKRDGEKNYRLATVGFLYEYISTYFPSYAMLRKPALDGGVYEDYARLLLPRAVGYSAGLLNYFFRGELQVSALPIFYKNGIQYVRVKIKNMTPNETMENGYFALAYRYTPTNGKPDGSDDKFGIALYDGDKTSAPCAKLESGKDMTVDFIIDPTIPRENLSSVKLTLAYRGTLGNEKGNEDGTIGAVIGKVFTLGEIKFDEEWDNALTGKHPWMHTDFDTSEAYPGHGITSNVIEGDTLIKDNIRFAGYKNASANGSFIGVEPVYPGHEDGFPILITPKTWLQFKIDQMSINQIPPAPPGHTNHCQGLFLYFNNGFALQLTQDGQAVYLGPNIAIWTFDLGLIFVNNIYQMFKDAGITPPEPLYLYKISFHQQLFELQDDPYTAVLQDPSNVEHHQHMEIDFISIVEEKEDEVKPQQ